MKNNRLLCMQVESLGVNGLALARGENAIGFRGIPLLPGYGRFDGKLPICTMKEMGPHDTDGEYHHTSFYVPVSPAAIKDFLREEIYNGNCIVIPDFKPGDAALVHLEWTFNGTVVYARFSTDIDIDFMLLINSCVSPAVVKSADNNMAVLSQNDWQVSTVCAGNLTGCMTIESTPERLECAVRGMPMTGNAGNGNIAGIRIKLTADLPLIVAMAEESIETPDRVFVDDALRTGRVNMEKREMKSAGSAADCADAIQRMIGFAAAYDVRSQSRYVPVNRDWAGPNSLPVVFMWDNFFDSYMASFNDPGLARESLTQIINIIRDNGMTGAPPQRNLIVPIIYSKTVRMIGDAAFIKDTFPVMMRFMRFWFDDRGDGHPWRDGNDDGLIECGTCQHPGDGHPLGTIIQNAFDETGYDDSPMYSGGFAYERRGIFAEGVDFDFHRGTLNLTMVGQNCLYAASCRAMAVIARQLGADSDEKWLTTEAERVSALIQDKLYDPACGFYMNRFFNGDFSSVKTPDIFTPLLAGIAADSVKDKLRESLLDPGQFWGDNIIPTVSRDDPAYCDDTRFGDYWRGNYWRGNIWGPTNYITYLSIRHAGWGEIAADFAEKSRRLFMDDWLTRHHVNENYPPTGVTEKTQFFTANGGRDPHYIWGGLLAVIALEQLFSVEDICEGIRFGTVEPVSYGSWDNFIYQNKRARVTANEDGVLMEITGLVKFTSDKPLAVCGFICEDDTPSFSYSAKEIVNIRLEWANGSIREMRLEPAINADVKAGS